MNGQTELQGLIKKQETLRHRMFLLILEVAFWFGIPAFGAFFLGNHLDDTYGTGSKYLIIFLIIAFVCSWIGVIWRTKTLAKKLTDAERRVREAKEIVEKRSTERPVSVERSEFSEKDNSINL